MMTTKNRFERRLSLIMVLVLIISFQACKEKLPATPVDYVDPFIGTGGHGHTFPGASLPFGMVQLSPDTRKDNWDACSGYHFSDEVVFGFSHTHLSGTGVADYGDIRLMPTVGAVQTEPGTAQNPEQGYGSRFSHNMESAGPGYYAVHLNDYDIYVGLTATERVGFHQYVFPKTDSANIIIDLKESVLSEEVLESEFKIINSRTVMGFRRTKAWANDQYIYFYLEFSKPFGTYGIAVDGKQYPLKRAATGSDLKAFFNFRTETKETIYVKVGISPVDYNGARNNMKTEIPHWDFTHVRKAASDKWADQMNKLQVGGGSEKQKRAFYTALYHSMLVPNLYSDADSRYRAHDLKIYKNEGFQMHTVFSLWDTFRTLHPLFTIIERDKTVDLIHSLLDMYQHDSLLAVWELAANETNCMIGYHSVPVIVDAWKKGIRDFDPTLALEAMVRTANADHFGLKQYREKGYIPADMEGESVSKTLEYAYDDWCIAEFAREIGDTATYHIFIQRAQYYKNLFDKHSGFFRGKTNGGFSQPFDPTQVNFMLTEANTWQYNFFVPQDINTMIQLHGGDAGFEAKLDELFGSEAGLSGRQQSDITGLIGQYAHGNEPSHHMAYLYNYVGKPWKTQKLLAQIMREMYSDQPDGLSGNEDCGQMSAWYVMSAMGFYPVTPGTDVYVIGTPLFDSLSIQLENGQQFRIVANGVSEQNIFVQSVSYNGNPWTKSYITQDMIMKGGSLVFEMASEPNTSWGSNPEDRPFQQIQQDLIVPVPNFVADAKTFEDKLSVSLDKLNNASTLMYAMGKEIDGRDFRIYEKPLTLDNTDQITAYAEQDGKRSFQEQAVFNKIPAGRKASIKYAYSDQYTAGGDQAVINTLRGGQDFRTGNWQGYYGVDFDALIDLGDTYEISKLGTGFFQDENSWILMPLWVRYEASVDGENYELLGQVDNEIDGHAKGGIRQDFVLDGFVKQARYLHVVGKNRGDCPEWNKGAGNPCWIFVDEVWFE